MMMEELFNQITNKYGENVLPLYKAEPPFTDFKEGEGFLGVLLYDSFEDKVQCHLCGEWFKGLSSHLYPVHKLDSQEYKEMVGLNRKTPLTALGTRRLQQEIALSRYSAKRERLQEGSRLYFRKHKYTTKRPKKRVQFANGYATCDLQLRDRFNKLKEEIGRIPRKEEVRFHSTLARRYGSYNNAVRAFGFAPTRYRPNYNKGQLLSFIREYKDIFGYMPKASDFVHNHLFPNPTTYLRNFESWSRAKKLALK